MLFPRRKKTAPAPDREADSGEIIEITGPRDPLSILATLPPDTYRAVLVVERDRLWPEEWKVVEAEYQKWPVLRYHSNQ